MRAFLHSFWFTVLFVIVSVILINLIAFFVAYALTLGIRGSNVFRTVFFVPNLVGGIILGYIWQYIFNGILQYYGTNLALNANFGFWGLVILMCWQQAGYMMIIYIAGFQSVPHDLYEAAKIDGAGKKQLLTNVTLPMMMPSITICTFLTLTNSFKLFDQNLAPHRRCSGYCITGKRYNGLSDGNDGSQYLQYILCKPEFSWRRSG